MQMSNLEKAVIELLRASLNVATVTIVSRSNSTLVARCCAQYMPRLREFLNISQIPFVRRETPNSVPLDAWMIGCLFFGVIDAREVNKRFVIVVVGGGAVLRHAAKHLKDVAIPDCSLKIVTLQREPDPVQLTQLAESLTECLCDTIEHIEDEQLTW